MRKRKPVAIANSTRTGQAFGILEIIFHCANEMKKALLSMHLLFKSPRLRASVVNLFFVIFSHKFLNRTAFLTLLVLASTVDGQVIRNQLPLVTQSSALAERLYAKILLDINSKEIERAQQSIEQLRTQFAGILISVADLYQVEATLLADQLIKISVATSENRHPSKIDRLDAFALWRSTLRGEFTTAELLILGDKFWLNGEIDSAQQCWRLASLSSTTEKTPPLDSVNETDTHVSNLDIQKREIVSYLLTGNFRLAQKSLERLKQTDPKTLGKVAGQEGVIYEILSRFAESLEFADHDSFLQREDRLPFESVRYDFVALDWSVPVHGNSTVSQVIEPLLWHETLLLQDVNGVRALNIETGQPAWSIGPEDQGYIFETTAFSETSTSIPMVCSGGVLNGHTWYGRSGVDGFLDNKPVDPSQQSRISALDLKAEGRLKWTRTPSDLSLNDQAQMRVFSGTPVVNGVHVYVPMRTSAPGNQLQIACINSEDGSEIWLSEVAASLKIPAKDDGYYDEINIEGISLYWLIDGVSVACIDAFDGQLQWVSAVQPIDEVVKQRVIGSQDLAISEDSILCITVNGIAAFNKFTGKLNWEQYLQDPPRSLLGVNDGLLIANDPGIYAIDVDSGEIVWQRKQLNSNSKPHIGVLKGRSIFYPDQDQLFTLDAYSGRVLQQDQFSNGLELPINGVHVFPSKLMTLHGNELRTFRAHSYTD